MTRRAEATDTDLVERMRAGDADALRDVVARYQKRIFALVYGIVRDHHEVEDVAQEVFLKVFYKIHAFDRRSKFFTWLYRVAANAAKDHVKKRSRRPAVPLDENADLAGDGDSPEGRAAARETQAMVRGAIDALPPRYREILTLRELEGLGYNEIAEVLQISIGTVESRLHRARKKLEKRLERHVRRRNPLQTPRS
jgi:RNA polymerase sigma-70 factor (ECF subfamily)